MKSREEDKRRAVRWLTAAVAQGHRGAMYDLGMVYLQGIKDIGLARDPARARALFEQALDGGGEGLYRYPRRPPKRAVESASRHPFTLGAGMKQRPNHSHNRPGCGTPQLY